MCAVCVRCVCEGVCGGGEVCVRGVCGVCERCVCVFLHIMFMLHKRFK